MMGVASRNEKRARVFEISRVSARVHLGRWKPRTTDSRLIFAASVTAWSKYAPAAIATTRAPRLHSLLSRSSMAMKSRWSGCR